MADITSVYQTYNNAGTGVAQADDNYLKFRSNQADVGRELVISVTRTNANGGLTDAVLQQVYAWITNAHGAGGVSTTGDAFTVAAIGTADGTPFVNTAAAIANNSATTTVYFRVQGTGSLVDAEADAGVANLTVATVAVFAPAL